MSSEDYCLKWNDHHSVFFSSVERLCNVDVLTDVTLSCGARTFSAHKLVLSVCSGYFAGLFANQARDARAGRLPPDYRHAIVYLKDVDPRHMELLLTYMYRGEINVQEHELMSFLAAAKSLQIKGLADGGSNDGGNSQQQNKSKPPTPISLPTRPLPMAQAKKRPLILAPGAGGESAAAKMMKDEMEENNGEGTSQNDDGAFSGDQLDDDDIDDDLTGEEGAVNPAELYEGGDIEGEIDSVVGKTLMGINRGGGPVQMNPGNPNRSGSVQQCPHCPKVMQRNHLEDHIRSHTGERPFPCGRCSYAATTRSNWKRHVLKCHQDFEVAQSSTFDAAGSNDPQGGATALGGLNPSMT